ncbi:MAG TPA: hypothetical protein VFU02_16835 [Polyangiaceae bacterium]|nr:hypothetical protein [Polyangiaceae bacterium]
MRRRLRKFLVKLATTTVILLGVGHTSFPVTRPHLAQAAVSRPSAVEPKRGQATTPSSTRPRPATFEAEPPKTVLTRSASWFVYPQGCAGVAQGFDLVIHFHGAHTTVIPRYLRSKLNAVLVIVNKGIGSGAYSDALALPNDVDGLLDRISKTIAEECQREPTAPRKIALSSWSAGYGAVQQVLRFRPGKVDAVLLSDGLHVGFSDERQRRVRVSQMEEFATFAKRAARGERLMAIAHSAITPSEYAGAGETALALAEQAHAPSWPVMKERYGMTQLTAARRGQFFVDGFAGTDKAAHAQHLYSIDRTSFARLRDYWQR